jgi:hypothetical protein
MLVDETPAHQRPNEIFAFGTVGGKWPGLAHADATSILRTTAASNPPTGASWRPVHQKVVVASNEQPATMLSHACGDVADVQPVFESGDKLRTMGEDGRMRMVTMTCVGAQCLCRALMGRHHHHGVEFLAAVEQNKLGRNPTDF